MVEIKFNDFLESKGNLELVNIGFDYNSILAFGKFLCAMCGSEDLVLHGVHEDETENCVRYKVPMDEDIPVDNNEKV